jgi:hypothetical protein
MAFVFEAEPQALDTGRFGVIHVLQTWVMRDKKISKLSNGAYVHTTGLPIGSKKEITEVIPVGPEQDEALYWFDHRDETPENPGRSIVMHADGGFTFDDGNPITSISEITQALKPGAHQELVVRWFVLEQEKKAQTQTKQKPEWQKPDQGEDPAPMKAAAPKKAVKKPVAPKKAVKTAAAAPAEPAQTGQETPPASF